MLNSLFQKNETSSPKSKIYTADLDGTEISLETGKYAQMSDGSVLIRSGSDVLLTTTNMSDNPREGMDFFPLLCDFLPKYYASGKIKGSRFLKREARPPESAILVARMMDRPLRPMFPKGMKNDVQIIANLLQSGSSKTIAPLAITSASLSTMLAGIPFEAPVSAVHVGMKEDGSFYLDPTFTEVETGKLDLMIAGSQDAIMMVEAGASLISDEQMVSALKFAHSHIKTLCKLQAKIVADFSPKLREVKMADEAEPEKTAVEKFISKKDLDEVCGKSKKELHEKTETLENKVLDKFAPEIENEKLSKAGLLKHLHSMLKENMRQNVFSTGKRVDFREADQIRNLSSEVGVFERLHGSGLFSRGATQVLSVLTVAGPEAEQLIDDPDRDEYSVRYMHHYNFPPFSVGEVKPLRGTNRREIGHGTLAERALRYVLPTKEEGFPYTLRVVSEVLSCNGSSSMASVCGSTLALMDGGIPIKKPIAGVAMGLIMQDDGQYKILTDICAAEDFSGDMDLKVCGDEENLTALQMDIKLKGLKMELIVEALAKAKIARQTILQNMKKAISEPRQEMSQFAPRVYSMKVDSDFIKVIIGKGGETIQKLCKDYDVKINIDDEGLIEITSTGNQAEEAIKKIEQMTYVPKIGDEFRDAVVKSVRDFGAFVEFVPGQEAMVHVSEVSSEHIADLTKVLKEGQKVNVKLFGKDRMGRLQLSIKQFSGK